MHPKIIDDEKLIELYNQGLNDKEIAKVFGVTRNAVRKRRDQLGSKSMYREKENERIIKKNEKIKELYNNGLDNMEIAKELNLNVSTVSKDLVELGLKTNRGYKRISREEVKRLLEQGLSDQEIAEKLGYRRTTIYGIRCILRIGINPATYKKAKKLQGKIRELVENGLTDREIGETLHYSSSHIGKIRRTLGLPVNIKAIMQPNRKFADEELIIDLKEKLTDKQIADKYKCSQSAVHLRRKKLGLKKNDAYFSDQEFKEAYYSGKFKTDKELAVYLNSTIPTVRKRRRKLGLKLLSEC